MSATNGIRMSFVSDATTVPNAPPMITATARSTTFPRIKNFLNPDISPPGSLSVGHAKDAAALIVTDEQRPVLEHQRVGGSGIRVARRAIGRRRASDAMQKPVDEGLIVQDLVAVVLDDHDAIANRLAAIPRSMLGHEDRVLVLGRKHRTRVKLHANRGDVRTHLQNRRHELRA